MGRLIAMKTDAQIEYPRRAGVPVRRPLGI
jgi:hypothetical protein